VATLPTAFKAFEKVRIPPVHRAMDSSLACGYIYEFLGKNKDNLAEIGPEITELTSWIDDFDPNVVTETAIESLRQMLQ
jgi:hypothetical protein